MSEALHGFRANIIYFSLSQIYIFDYKGYLLSTLYTTGQGNYCERFSKIEFNPVFRDKDWLIEIHYTFLTPPPPSWNG